MQFASKTPRDLNHDFLPYINDCPDMWNRYPDEYTANYFSGGVYRFDPRPEFDHVQHNPTNTILPIVRRYSQARFDMSQVAAATLVIDHWQNLLVVQEASEEERAHAFKVLARLAKF